MEYLQNLVEKNQSLLGLQTDVEEAGLQAKKDLIPLSTNVAKLGLETEAAGLEEEARLIPERAKAQHQRLGLVTSFMDDAMDGVDVGERMDLAQAGVQHGFKNARATTAKNISSYGLDPSSGMFASQNRGRELAEASNIAGARTKARVGAEDENFQRKRAGLQVSI